MMQRNGSPLFTLSTSRGLSAGSSNPPPLQDPADKPRDVGERRAVTSRQSILLVGAGGHARSCIDVIEQNKQFEIAGLIGLPQEVGAQVLGYKVLGSEEILPDLLGDYPYAIVTIGQIKSPQLRMKYFNDLQEMGFELPVIISPLAYVSPHARVGKGTIIMHGAIVNAGAVIGNNCIINSRVLIEHDAHIADHCHISTAAVVNGGVRIDAGSFVGSQTSIRQSIHIGQGCVIGMGQHVLKDCASNTMLPLIKGPV